MKITKIFKQFLGTLLVMAEVIGFILIFGIAGGVEQDSLTIADGIKYWLICGGVMFVIGLVIYVLCLTDRD